jgi:peroxiredoxin
MPALRRICSFLFITLLVSCLAGLAADPPPSSPVKPDDDAKKIADGKKAPKFSLEDTTGATHTLEDFAGKTLVLIWINPSCPGTTRLFRDGQMKSLLDELDDMNRDKTIAWLGVCSDAGASAKQCDAFARDNKIDLAILMDSDGQFARKIEAKRTPHVFVIDGDSVIRYEGAFDDDPTGAKKTAGHEVLTYPLQAVQAIRDGRDVSPKSVTPYGLPIRFSPLGSSQ